MNGILEHPVPDPCLDAARLNSRPAEDWWRMLIKVGAALTAPGRPCRLRYAARVESAGAVTVKRCAASAKDDRSRAAGHRCHASTGEVRG